MEQGVGVTIMLDTTNTVGGTTPVAAVGEVLDGDMGIVTDLRSRCGIINGRGVWLTVVRLSIWKGCAKPSPNNWKRWSSVSLN